MGTAVARAPRTQAQRLIEAKRALDMRLAGVDDVDICRELRISRATLFRWIRIALDFQLDPTVEQYREEAAGRIRESRRRIYERLNATQLDEDAALAGIAREVPVCDPGQTAALIGRLVQLEDLEAKLRGGYAPTKVDVNVRVREAFDELLDEINRTAPHDSPAATAAGANRARSTT